MSPENKEDHGHGTKYPDELRLLPPEENGGAWRATLDSLERALREAFPDPTIGHRRSGVHEMTVLDFEIELAPDVWLDGTASIAEPDYAYITLTDVTAEEAGTFAVWLRDSFAPAPDLVRFASSLAMANGEDTLAAASRRGPRRHR